VTESVKSHTEAVEGSPMDQLAASLLLFYPACSGILPYISLQLSGCCVLTNSGSDNHMINFSSNKFT
jgi:hypothetical protein